MIELTPTIDDKSGEPLYMQLYGYIRGEIAAGRIPAQARLPSIRRLAAHLGVSRTPVALAYEQLLAEGYLTSRPRSGLFAAELNEPGFTETGGRAAKPAPVPPSPPHGYGAARDEAVRCDFGYGSVDAASFPLAKWRKLVNLCLMPENSRLLQYGELQGEPELRGQIAAYLHQVRGVRCLPEQIVIGAGTYHSLDLLFRLLQPDVARMAVEESVNDGVKALFGRHRFQCSRLRLEPDGIRVEDLYEGDAQAVYVTPSHQFPLGMTMSAGKRVKLLRWAQERQAYLIENDYDGEFRYGGRPIPSLQSLDEEGRCIYVGTFSRALTPAFRLSYLVLPQTLLARFRQGRTGYDQLASPIFQQALQLFMSSGDFGRHMRKMRSLYHRKHDALLSAVRRVFRDEAEVIGAGSGLHVLLRVENGMSETELVSSALAAGIKVYPISAYALWPEAAMKSTVLLGFGGLTEEGIREGIDLLGQEWSAV